MHYAADNAYAPTCGIDNSSHFRMNSSPVFNDIPDQCLRRQYGLRSVHSVIDKLTGVLARLFNR